MNRIVQHTRIHLLSLSLLAIAIPAMAQQDPAASLSSSQANLHSVERGELTLRVESEGRIDSAEKIKVRLVPQEFKGSFEVEEVLRRSGRVKKGEVLLRLDGQTLEKEIANAQMALDHAQRRLEIAREEQRIQNEANAVTRERAQKSRTNAETELAIWEKYDSPGMLKSAELNLKQREFGLADQKQELEQLEAMYSGTHLATETKDIVLERARRGVIMSEQWLVLAKNSDLVTREYRHALQDRNVRDSLRWVTLEEQHTVANTNAAEQRKKMELEAAERGLKDAQENLAELQADLALLVVTAPSDGIMTRIDLEPHDVVGARQPICEILNPSKLIVKFPISAEDLRVIGNGESASLESKITLRLQELPDVSLTGNVEELSEIGVPADKATHFPLTIALTTKDPMVRLGMRCKLFATRTIPDALTVPTSAVTWEHGEPWVTVQTPDGAKARPIVVGATAGDRVAVIDGLAIGEQVLLKEASSK